MGAIRRIRRTAKRLTQRAAESDIAPPPARNVNVADASNVVVSSNVADSGSVEATPSSQRVQVRQNDDDSYAESAATQTRT